MGTTYAALDFGRYGRENWYISYGWHKEHDVKIVRAESVPEILVYNEE